MTKTQKKWEKEEGHQEVEVDVHRTPLHAVHQQGGARREVQVQGTGAGLRERRQKGETSAHLPNRFPARTHRRQTTLD